MNGVSFQPNYYNNDSQESYWVNVTLMVIYWIFTIGAIFILFEVLKGMALRAYMLRRMSATPRKTPGGASRCCSKHSLNILAFYIFAIITLASCALQMTLTVVMRG